MSPKIKNIIIVIVIIVIAFFGYQMYFVSSTPAAITLVAEQAAANQFVDGQAILTLLNNLNRVTLDESIFSNKIFISLTDFGKPIQEQAIGRQNPFLPIGVDNAGVIIVPKSTSTVKTR